MTSVLVAVEDAIVAGDLQTILAKKGHLVTAIAYTGVQAAELVAKEIPGLILMDFSLVDNLELADLFTGESSVLREVPIIYLTCLTNRDFPKLGRLQSTIFISKPFVEEELVDCIEKILSGN